MSKEVNSDTFTYLHVPGKIQYFVMVRPNTLSSVLQIPHLRLDNTGAWVMEVYPSLLCALMPENDDLYIELKLGLFSFI